jgi:hypothetical protein
MRTIALCCLAGAAALAVAAAPLLALDANGPSWRPREVVTSTLGYWLYQDGADRILGFDHFGDPGIAFYDGVSQVLRYARRAPGVGWVSGVVDSNGVTGKYPSLAYDRYERPAISYWGGPAGDLRFAAFDGTKWNVQTVDTLGNVGKQTHLAFDLYGRPAIAYWDDTNNGLRFIRDTDGDMRLDDETPVQVTSGAFDGKFSSLAFDRLNRPMIAHYDSNDTDLIFTVEEPGVGWVSRTVDDVYAGLENSLAVSPRTGEPSVAYYRNGDLYYARWDGNTWVKTAVDTSNTTGGQVSLAFDPADGNPAISYYDYTTDDLRFAWFDGSIWHTQTLDSGGEIGRWSSLAFNEYGTGWPAIAYFDGNSAGSGHLFYIEDPQGVPEPASVAAILAGAAALLARRRGCARKAAQPSPFL